MQTTHLDGFPGLWDLGSRPLLRVHGTAGFLQTATRIARIDLDPARIAWVVERHRPLLHESSQRLPRSIHSWGGELWADGRVIAELIPAPEGSIVLSARDATTGRECWQQHVSSPSPAAWAEPTPAYPGAPTEEIHAFLADVPDALVLCMTRTTRCQGVSGNGIEILTLPPFACQFDAMRLDPLTGRILWRASFPDVHVGIVRRACFDGLWATGDRVGRISFDTGANAFLHQSSHRFGWPARVGSTLAAPWHTASRVGVDWLDESGRVIRSASWTLKGTRSTMLHPTDAGLVVQTNDQRAWLLGDEDAPLWDVRAKPYIYGVHQRGSSPVFIGTDGNGGRLFGLDLASGTEVLNLRPAIGGAGGLAKVPGHDVLVCPFTVSRSHWQPSRLLVLDMRTMKHERGIECGWMLGIWEHGAICCSRRGADRLSVLDIRSQPS